MRLRLRELLDREGITPYRLAADSHGRLHHSWLYRRLQTGGQFNQITPDQLAALMEGLNCTAGELLESPPRRHR